MDHAARLGLALGTALAVFGLTACGAAGPSPVVTGAPLPPVPVAVTTSNVTPPSPPSIPPATTERRTTTATTATTATTSTTSTTSTGDEVSEDECDRIAMRSDISNAELRPYLRSIGCDDAADGLLVGAADEETGEDDGDVEAPGTAALTECTEQTGMTRAACIADAAAGTANGPRNAERAGRRSGTPRSCALPAPSGPESSADGAPLQL